jgi:peroxiredoxin
MLEAAKLRGGAQVKLDKKALIMAAAVAALAILLGWLLARTPFEERRPAVGEMAPQLHLADATGRMVNLDDHLGGAVLINFWADWCPPCKDELKWFERVYADYRDRGLEIVAISIEDLEVRDVVGLDVSFPVAVANKRVIEAYGDISGVPVSFLVGRDGRIIRKVKRAWPEEQLRLALEAALSGR